MSCCKGGTTVLPKENTNQTEINSGNTLKNYVVKILIFLVMLAAMPIIVLGIIWLLFKNIILSKDIDIIPLLRKFIKKTDSKLNFEEHNAEDDKELIYKVYNPDDYALLNVEKNN